MIRPLLDAAGYAVRFPTLGVILLLSAFPGALGLSYNYLIPVAARDRDQVVVRESEGSRER